MFRPKEASRVPTFLELCVKAIAELVTPDWSLYSLSSPKRNLLLPFLQVLVEFLFGFLDVKGLLGVFYFLEPITEWKRI